MKQFQPDNIHNIILLSHSGSGKTSLAEAILFSSGAISRLGRVDADSTTSDYDPDEMKRKISINLTLLPCQWQDKKINLVDVPGYSDFVGEVMGGIRVCEATIILVSAAAGIEVGTEQAWKYSEDAGLTRLIFINKIDRENANFNRTFEQIQSRFGNKCIALQIPIGAHNDFKGIIDLLKLKCYIGEEAEESEIPTSLKDQVDSMREKMIETIAEVDDVLIEKYLAGEEISREELEKGLKQAITSGKIIPVLTGSALQNIAVRQLLDAICNYLPSAAETEIVTTTDSKIRDVKPEPESPLAALIFKTSADPYVGKLTYFRVFSGTIESNSQVWNVNQGSTERIGQLFIMRGKNQEPVPRIGAGDIGAVAKLNITVTGDTLGHQDKPVKIMPVTFPEPIYSVAVHPKTKADLDKLGSSLARLTEEDLTLRMHRDNDTGETILSGMGDTQLDVAAEKMLRKFGVSVELTIPKVPYKETITQSAKAEYKHKKQSGGHGQYGHVLLELTPLSRDSVNEFTTTVVGGSVPKNYFPAVEKGVNEAAKQGVLAGYPVVNVKANLFDGSFHPVDSSEICFKIAGAGAFRKGLSDGQPILLEPIMDIRVIVPSDSTGDIMGDLNTKRARVQGMNPADGNNIVEAQAPLAEMLRYAIDLKSMTQGRGTYSMKFSHFEEVPMHISQKIIDERKAEKEADKS
ncbi:MAG: elongation factor G [Dehalococcoidia bacterium]|nr:MAG: elongation factor G [Dehalococcoidia bacterium]